MTSSRAVFLDRDGVIVRDDGTFQRSPRLVPLPGAAEAIRAANEAGHRVIVVTNQPVVARGIASEDDIRAVHEGLAGELAASGAVVDAFYFCPHHPNGDLEAFRIVCECRKPRPGLLLAAAKMWGIALTESVMIGDRLSDVAAGARAGCRTALVRTGMHDAPPIASPDRFDDVVPDVVADDLHRALRALGVVR